MRLDINDLLLIPYGSASWSIDQLAVKRISLTGFALDSAAPIIAIDRRRREALRLSHNPYPFSEPPDPSRLVTREERLDFLRDHLKSLCGLWNRLPLVFLDAYFRRILGCLEENRAALDAMALPLGGLFDYRDWCFAALRPLPQAQLYAPEAGETSGFEPAALVRVDFAFWTGEKLLAVELVGSATPTRQRREELVRLRRHAVEVVELAGAALQGEGEAALAACLPASFSNFWAGVMLPSSPFAPTALDEILPASGT